MSLPRKTTSYWKTAIERRCYVKALPEGQMVLHWKGRGRRACEAALGAKEDLNAAVPRCQQVYTSKLTFAVPRYLADVISPQGLEARQRECEKK